MAFLNHSHRLHSPTYTPTFAITVSHLIFPSMIHKCPSQRFLVPSTLQSGCLACGQCIPVLKIFAKQSEEQFFSTEHPLLHLHANVYIRVFSFPSPATPPLPSRPFRGLPGSVWLYHLSRLHGASPNLFWQMPILQARVGTSRLYPYPQNLPKIFLLSFWSV